VPARGCHEQKNGGEKEGKRGFPDCAGSPDAVNHIELDASGKEKWTEGQKNFILGA
jgi:hypothetical protein